MGDYLIFEALHFKKSFAEMHGDIRSVFVKKIDRLKQRPYGVGRPLGVAWFRELKHTKYRVYYIVYDDRCVVLLAETSAKKDQQSTIDVIRSRLPLYKDLFVKGERYKNEK